MHAYSDRSLASVLSTGAVFLGAPTWSYASAGSFDSRWASTSWGVLAENVRPDPLPESLTVLRARGVPVIAHAVSLSLGGAEPVDPARG
jgi:hypothetical protein